MRSLERLLIAIAVVAIGWIASMMISSRSSRSRSADVAAIAGAEAGVEATDADEAMAAGSANGSASPSTPDRDDTRIAWLLSSRSAGTYFAEMLAASDSMNHRWPDRSSVPMRVWVQELPDGTPGWRSDYPQLVRDAFSIWADAGVPIHFSFVTDSSRAEIHVTWTDRFEQQMTGRTRWAHDRDRWIVGGGILLALHVPDGRALGPTAVHAIALHEVGHLIGLDHSPDPADIMSSLVRVPVLSEADRVTARLVYSLPPGSLKAAR